MSFWTEANLVLQPILKPAVNDWPLAPSRTEIEKVRPFCLQVSEEEKAAHHAGLVGVLFSPSVVCTKDRLSRLFLLHARHEDPSRCGEDPDDRHPLDKVLHPRQASGPQAKLCEPYASMSCARMPMYWRIEPQWLRLSRIPKRTVNVVPRPQTVRTAG